MLLVDLLYLCNTLGTSIPFFQPFSPKVHVQARMDVTIRVKAFNGGECQVVMMVLFYFKHVCYILGVSPPTSSEIITCSFL